MTALFSKILDMSLTASVVILAVLLVRLCLKKSPKMISYVLWAVVLFRLLCPVAISAPVSLLHVSQPQVTASGERTSQLSYLPAPSGQSQVHQPVDIPAQIPASQPMTPVSPTSQSAPAAREESPRKSESSLLNVAAGAWLAGVAIMVLHSAISYARLCRRLVGATPFREEVYLADHITSPFVLGILQPRIYLPSDIPSRERQYILAHERHHIHRGDHVIKLLAYAALCLHWFNPLVWVAFFQAGKDMEMSCDEAVIRGLSPDTRADYAQTLLRLATHQRIIAGTPLAFGEGETKGRVLNIAKWRKPKRWVVLLSVALCAVVLVACGVNPQADAPKDTVDETKAEETIADKGTEPVTDGTIKMGLSLPLDVVDVDYGEYGEGEKRFFLTEPIPGQISSQVIPEPVLGGIRVYDAPDESWTDSDLESWLLSLHVLPTEYDWIASASEDAEVEVSFIDGKGREAKHYYYTQGDRVFELWLNTDALDAMTRAAIQRSVYFAEDASITRDLPLLNEDSALTMLHSSFTTGNIGFQLPLDYWAARDYDTGELYIQQDSSRKECGGVRAYPVPKTVVQFDGRDFSNYEEWLDELGINTKGDWSVSTSSGLWENPTGPYGVMSFGTDTEVHRFYIYEEQVYELWFNTDLVPELIRRAIYQSVTFSPEAEVQFSLPKSDDSTWYLQRCRDVVDTFKYWMQYNAVVTQVTTGNDVYNGTTTISYWRSGDDWMKFISVPQSGILDGVPVWENRIATMYADGVYYDNTKNPSLDDDGRVTWNRAEQEYENDLWLANFEWNDRLIELVSVVPAGKGECVTLRVAEPYIHNVGAYGEYTVRFVFLSGGSLDSVETTAWFRTGSAAGDYYITQTIRLMTDPRSAEMVIAEEAQRVPK